MNGEVWRLETNQENLQLMKAKTMKISRLELGVDNLDQCQEEMIR